MKKFTTSLFIIAISCLCATAFDFGGIVKAVAGEGDSNSALKAKQTAMLNSYNDSKENLFKAYSNILESLGQESAAKQANDALKIVENKKNNLSVKELTALSDDIIAKTDSSKLKNTPNQITNEMKEKYTKGLTYFKNAIQSEISAGKQAVEIARDAKAVISSGSAVQRIELASTFEPTTSLIKIIPDDIAKLKKNVSALVSLAKSKGITVPDSLMSILK